MYTSESQYAVGWITLAFITAGIASAMNRTRGWGLLSIFLGPVALIILVLCGRSK